MVYSHWALCEREGDTHHDQRRGVGTGSPGSILVEPGALLVKEALVTVALQHGIAHGPTPQALTARSILEACLRRVASLDWSRKGRNWRR